MLTKFDDRAPGVVDGAPLSTCSDEGRTSRYAQLLDEPTATLKRSIDENPQVGHCAILGYN